MFLVIWLKQGEMNEEREKGGQMSAVAVNDGVCAICLDCIELQETALVKGCEHVYWFVSPLFFPCLFFYAWFLYCIVWLIVLSFMHVKYGYLVSLRCLDMDIWSHLFHFKGFWRDWSWLALHCFVDLYVTINMCIFG